MTSPEMCVSLPGDAKRSNWVFRCRGPDEDKRQPHRRIAHRSSVERKHCYFSLRLVVVLRGESMKKFMGMLTVRDGKSERSFALLEQFGG